MELNTWLLFVVAEFVIAIMPGPAVILVTSQALKYDAKHSFAGSAGILLVNLLYYVISSLGIVTIIMSISNVLTIVKYAGTAYLLVLGVSMIYQSYTKVPHAQTVTIGSKKYSRLLYQGMVTELANPKAVLFFMAFLPQFVNMHQNLPVQFAILCATGTIIEAVILVAYGLAADKSKHLLTANPRLEKIKDRIAGIALVGIAIKLGVRD